MKSQRVNLVLCIVALQVPVQQAERFLVPETVCGRVPNLHLCDALPVGIEETELDNGRGRPPTTCAPGQYCPYGMVTYGFGRNNYAQLGVGDYRDREVPEPMATAYAKVDRITSGAEFNILRWEGENVLYSWGRGDSGQLGQGPDLNDTLPNKIFSIERPVLIQAGAYHSLVTLPPATADFFEFDDFAGTEEQFVHYGDSIHAFAPPQNSMCPCLQWEKAYQPLDAVPQYSGINCYLPSWTTSVGISAAGKWCFVQKGGDKPCTAAASVTIAGQLWWTSICNDLAKFRLTPEPSERLAAGAVWRKQKVQVYQAWKMSFFFTIYDNDPEIGGGDGIVFVVQNNGINKEDQPVGGSGKRMGIARTGRYNFDAGIPNAVGIALKTSGEDAGLEVRSCKTKPYVTENSGEFTQCSLAISEWKPEESCNPLAPDSCCTDSQVGSPNACFTEDVKNGAPHELMVVYSPFQLSVFLDDPRTPKIVIDFDIREHIRSYVCEDGPRRSQSCYCDGEESCGGVEDTEGCQGFACVVDGTAWLGFTSSTGDAFSVHDITSWNFVNLGQDGSLLSFGRNWYGQLGLDDLNDKFVWNMVTALDGIVVVDVAGGATHSIALSSQGVVYTWGGNNFGQLGQGDVRQRETPTKVRTLDSMATAAAAGDPCTCGTVTTNCQNLPTMPPCKFQVVKVTAGAYHSLAVVERDNHTHEVWGWGDNAFGQLGCLELFSQRICPWNFKPPGTLGNWPDEEMHNRECSGTNERCMTTPRRLSAFDRKGDGAMVMKPYQLVSGAFHNILITDDCPECPLPSRCASQGLTRDMCDCDGGARNRDPQFEKQWVLEPIDCIAKGREIYTWGSNVRGQLGSNCSNFRHHDFNPRISSSKRVCPDSPELIRLNSPKPLPLLPYYPDIFRFDPANNRMLRRPQAVAAGAHHNILLMEDSTVYVWGSNYFGQLGLGDRRMRVAPTLLDYFAGGFIPAPNVGPLDGLGESITVAPDPVFSAKRKVNLVSAGQHHSVVATECSGAGFRPDGSCDCAFGWKGVDCNIQCNGGANNSCSLRGTFDQSNSLGDRTSCRAYLDLLATQGKWNNDGKCIGLKTSSTAGGAGCPGGAAENCPTECAFCDDELYDCENDGSCYCESGFTGPDCGFNCIPVEGKYFFLSPLAGVAICECDAEHTGMYCNETIESTVQSLFVEQTATAMRSRTESKLIWGVLLCAAIVLLTPSDWWPE